MLDHRVGPIQAVVERLIAAIDAEVVIYSRGDFLRRDRAIGLARERFGLLSAEEQRRIVYGWNDTERAFPSERLIHQDFEETGSSVMIEIYADRIEKSVVHIGLCGYPFSWSRVAVRAATATYTQLLMSGRYLL